MKCVFRMEETKDSVVDQELEEKFNEEVDKIVESGKKKRKMSEAQLATLAAGRSKRWEKKQAQAKELAPIAEEKVEEKEELDIGEKKKSKAKVQIKEEPLSSDDSDDCSSYSGKLVLKSFLTQVQVMIMLLILVLLMNLLSLIYLVLMK